MELQVGGKILLKNKDGKFLLLHKNPANYPNIMVNELLDIPGGRINPGTSLLENLKREIYEETKLRLIEEPKLITAQDILKTDKHVVRLTYLGEADGEVKLSDEHSEYRWLTLEEISVLEPMDSYFKNIINIFI